MTVVCQSGDNRTVVHNSVISIKSCLRDSPKFEHSTECRVRVYICVIFVSRREGIKLLMGDRRVWILKEVLSRDDIITVSTVDVCSSWRLIKRVSGNGVELTASEFDCVVRIEAIIT